MLAFPIWLMPRAGDQDQDQGQGGEVRLNPSPSCREAAMSLLLPLCVSPYRLRWLWWKDRCGRLLLRRMLCLFRGLLLVLVLGLGLGLE